MLSISPILRAVRDVGPLVLIPAAWVAAGAAIFEHLSTDGILIAHVVMAAFITFFTVTGWKKMDDGALRAWRAVLVAGLFVTLSGIVGLLVPAYGYPLVTISLVGWMLLPAAGLVYTGMQLPAARIVYFGGATLSVAGTVLYGISLVESSDILVALALASVGIGQTAGIVDASRRDR